MSLIRNIFGAGVSTPTTVNREGYPAWTRPLAEQYLQTLLTNTLGRTFYASARELLADTEAVHTAMLAEDPAFAAAALAYARQRGFMRSQPVYGLARLASVEGPHFEAAFPRVIRTPNDLADFATVVASLRGGEGGRRIKRVAGRWLLGNLSEYWAIKYGGKSRRGGYTLRDLVRVYHPKAKEHRALIAWVLGRAGTEATASLPQVSAFERLKRATSAAERVAAIHEGRLPHEVATPFAGKDPAVWEAIVPQLPVFALVKHLAALERHAVLDANRAHVEATLGDPQIIARSKVLPFRFADAADKVETPWAQDALRGALDLAFANIPPLAGRVAVMLDRSASMSGRYMRVAAIFAVCAMKAARLNGRLLLFDHQLEEVAVSARDSVLTQAAAITARGGTDTALPMQQLLADRDAVDTIVMITDEQQNTGAPFHEVLATYRARVNPSAKVFILDVSPYRTAMTPDADPLTHYVYGWSDQALSFISMASGGFGTLVDRVRRHGVADPVT